MVDLALFGAGRMGNIHARGISNNPKARLKYIADPNAVAASALAEEYNIEVSAQQDILADPSIDGIVITATTKAHTELVLAACSAGKAIFCEKPLDLDISRVNQCLDTLDASSVPLCLGFQRRFDPSFAKVRRAIDEGQIGQLEVLQITSRDPSPPPTDYIRVCGGIFADMMIHDLDIALWLLDSPIIEVYANGSCLVSPVFAEYGDIDTAMVTLKAANGALTHINNSRRAVYGYDQRLEILGSKGLLQVGNQTDSFVTTWNESGLVGEKPCAFFPQRYAHAYQAEIDHFVQVVLGEATPLISAVDGRNSLLLAHAAAQSFEAGQPVAVEVIG